MVTMLSSNRCKHCGHPLGKPDWYGDIVCLMCGREHDKNGNLIKLISGREINPKSGARIRLPVRKEF